MFVNPFLLHCRPGSVVVDYRVSWTETNSLNVDSMKERLTNYLDDNHNYLATYIVPANTIRVARLPDLCYTGPAEMGYDFK